MEQCVADTDHITIDQILTILDNYRIGKKPLAKLLGWGETTIIRYVEGDTPTAEYSDKLKMILNNPGYFYELLLKNEGQITQVAFKKCCKAVLKQMMQSKISIIAQYIINKRNGNISLYVLQKYLYYIQCFSLALRQEPMFEDELVVVNDEFRYERVYNDYQTRRITVLAMEENSLEKVEKAFIDDVLAAFDWYGPCMIKSLVGFERLMMLTVEDVHGGRYIEKEVLQKYFLDILERYRIETSKEIHNYPDKRFLEIKNIQSGFAI